MKDLVADVVNIISENTKVEMKKDGEIELDISELNNRTLWRLDAYLKEHNVQPGSGTGVVVNKVSSELPLERTQEGMGWKGSSSESSSSFGDSDSESDASSRQAA